MRGHLPPVSGSRDERIRFLPRIESFAPRNTSRGARTPLLSGQATPAQKYKCNPSCIVLLFRAVRLICPKFPTVGSAFGSANSG
jgi:hypothetical protein